MRRLQAGWINFNTMKKRKRNHFCARLSVSLGTFLLCFVLLNGCGVVKVSEEKTKELDYTVVSSDKLPAELLTMIDEKKEQPFRLTFEDNGYLYICQGYGKKERAGYSIRVEDAYMTQNAICFSTTLIGPSPNDEKNTQATYPYIVVKTQQRDLTVVFK